MKLSDIVGAATGLAIYAEVGLVLFLLAFAIILLQVFTRGSQGEFQSARALPLESDDGPVLGTKGREP